MPPSIQAPVGAMPWIAPTDPLTQTVLAKLGVPLAAAASGDMFDAREFYAQFERREISRLERQVEAAGSRPEWCMEEVAYIDEEDSAEQKAAYEAACVEIDGYLLPPRCLDAFTMLAYQVADIDEDGDPVEAEVMGDLEYALDWARAGVCVLQQSLPYPFTGVLPARVEHRSAYRLLFAYASLLRRGHPRKAGAWFRAMVYLDPTDRMGAGAYATASSR